MINLAKFQKYDKGMVVKSKDNKARKLESLKYMSIYRHL